MIKNELQIPINIDNNKIELLIYGESTNRKTVFEVEKTVAFENGESPYQLLEGNFYEYKISDGYCLKNSEVINNSKVNPSSGRISPNIFVGTLSIDILNSKTLVKAGEIKFEVQSIKTSYRNDYRYMLEEITAKCTDLLLLHNTPITQNIEVDFNQDSKTLYQRFAFIKSILVADEFSDSIHKIISSPVTKWAEHEVNISITGVRKLSNNILKQFANTGNRINLPGHHPLKNKINSVPLNLKVNSKTETVDTPENRFIKHAVSSFIYFIRDIRIAAKKESKLFLEANELEDYLEGILSYPIFKEISKPKSLPLNSPILQKKEGYREILRVWLMFNLAAKLVWHGGDNVYDAGKRDVAVLYEYWLFFKLLEIIKDVFEIEPKNIEDLIKPTNDGLGLQLQQGNHIAINGVYNNSSRKLNVIFSYNRTFSGNKEYPMSGSWSQNLRPDYTLSIWPFGINERQAEEEELIVHIHFDAKYKVENLFAIFGDNGDLNEEKNEQNKGTYKRADLLKMHTYKDAIRRTAGAYILYPGDKSTSKKGFHELLPGLGAFAIKPSDRSYGVVEIKAFLNDVVFHFLNRASQREKTAFSNYDVHKNKESNELRESLPEAYGENRGFSPDDTFILVCFYKDESHLNWIINNGLYNARIENDRGSLKLGREETGAKYLLLHSKEEITTSKLYKISEIGPRIFSKEKLIEKHYPSTPSQNFYLVYRIEQCNDIELVARKWDISKLSNYKSRRGSAIPFSTSFTELMKVVCK